MRSRSLAATAFNVRSVLRYSRSDTQLASEASRDEARAADLRRQAVKLRATVDPKQIEFASAEARQANALIDRRTFSWTELFNRFETTLPDDVRIIAVTPTIDKDRGIVLTVRVAARSVQDVEKFIDNLDATKVFTGLLTLEDHYDDQGALISGDRSRLPARTRESVAMNIARRIFTEKRAFIVPLLLAVVANLLVYALVVYPLRVKSRGAADRAKNAVTTLRAAEQDFAAARALVTGKSRAEQELLTFYGKVLPADQLSALRLTYGPLPALARKANVKVLSRRWTPEPPKPDARVARLVVHVSLEGDYEAFRQFVYALETAPEFVVVDDVTISLEDPGKPLTFKLELSTYYPVGAAGG